MMLLRRICASFLTIMTVLTPCFAAAIPLTLQMPIDELNRGRAVLTGDLIGAAWVPGQAFDSVQLSTAGTVNWSATVGLERFIRAPGLPRVDPNFNYRIQFTRGLHISNPPPHRQLGEVSPGPTLNLPTLFDLRGLVGGPGNPTRMASLLHAGGLDPDTMVATLNDLDPGGSSFLNPVGFGISYVINLDHPVNPVPEPSTLLLLGSGLAGLVGLRRQLLRLPMMTP